MSRQNCTCDRRGALPHVLTPLLGFLSTKTNSRAQNKEQTLTLLLLWLQLSPALPSLTSHNPNSTKCPHVQELGCDSGQALHA